MAHAASLSHWVFPRAGNRHQPHLLRASSLVALALLILGIQLIYNFSVTGQARVLSYATNVTKSDLFALSNAERANAGLAPLQENPALSEAARRKAADMLARDYWAHQTPDGQEPWIFLDQVGYSYSFAGENLAKSFNTSAGVIEGWMNSPGHRANLLGSDYQEIGLAAVNGELGREETTLVVAFYGKPGNSALVAAAESPEELAPSPRDYSPFQAEIVAASNGWARLTTIGMIGAILPVYALTHVAMWRQRLHQTSRWLWRRRWLEFSAIALLFVTLLLRSVGSVG